MKPLLHLIIPFIFLIQACGQRPDQHSKIENASSSKISVHSKNQNNGLINPDGKTIGTRILTPFGFERVKTEENSFEAYLRTLPLKPHNSLVKLYNGKFKTNNGIYDAVVDLNIGNKDLHQCADAVIRLRAEYFYQEKQYHKIHFNFTNGFRADYSEWMKGKRIAIKGNSASWILSANPSTSYPDFWKYLEIVFSYAGTLSLSKELQSVKPENLKIGDIFIMGGSPGHAVIVVDVAKNNKSGKKIFLLAQSYMPAQEIQILKNPVNKDQSPWYDLDFGNVLETPEWTFSKNNLKRFSND
jgi:hypothetical protein